MLPNPSSPSNLPIPLGPGLKPPHLPPFQIRQRTEEDSSRIPTLMREVYPPPHGTDAIWQLPNLLKHLKIFPEGQFVAETWDGKLIASATTMRTSWERGLEPHTWSGITGRGTLVTHRSDGPILYGVDIAVDPAYQGSGVARGLYQARVDLGRKLGCAAFVAGARVAGFAQFARRMTIHEYIAAVVRGELFDPTLTKQLQVGFTVVKVLPEYNPDPETLGFAALIFMRLNKIRQNTIFSVRESLPLEAPAA